MNKCNKIECIKKIITLVILLFITFLFGVNIGMLGEKSKHTSYNNYNIERGVGFEYNCDRYGTLS